MHLFRFVSLLAHTQQQHNEQICVCVFALICSRYAAIMRTRALLLLARRINKYYI